MGFLGIRSNTREADAGNIEQSMLTAKKSTDGLRKLAVSTEQQAELLGKRADQLSSLNLSNTSIFRELFAAFQHYQGLARDLTSVLSSVVTAQNKIEHYKTQHELPKASRENNRPGTKLAKLSTITASNASLTLAKCLQKKAEIDSASSSPLNEKALEVLSALDQHDEVGIKGIARPISPAKFSEIARAKQEVTKKIGSLDKEHRSQSAKTTPNASRLNLSSTPNASRLNLSSTPNASRLNLSETLVVSYPPEQALIVSSIQSSLDEITDIENKLVFLLKDAKDRVAQIDNETGKLDSEAVGYHSRNQALLTLRNNGNQLVNIAENALVTTSNHKKPLIKYLLASEQLPKEERNPKAPDSKKSLSLASKCVTEARELLKTVENKLSYTQSKSKG